MTAPSADGLREEVRRHYASAALAVAQGGSACCGPSARDGRAAAPGLAASPGPSPAPGASCGSGCCSPATLEAADAPALLYGSDLAAVPAVAADASLGCGNPVAVADLRPGETVLDLGSGGGIDLVLSARRVGPEGTVYGLDMTDEMLALAQRTLAEAGVRNVHLLRGVIEQVPLPAASVDAVISNCVVNLSTDKPAVWREVARVLRPGGRLGISDIVAENRLSPDERAARGAYAGCIAGALSRSELLAGLVEAGLAEAEVTFTHEVADGIHAAIVRARRPAA